MNIIKQQEVLQEAVKNRVHVSAADNSCPEINGHGATRGRPPTQLLHTVFAIRDREFLVVTLNPCYVCKLPGLFMILCYLTFLWSLHY